jgi:hypothetical protein
MLKAPIPHRYRLSADSLSCVSSFSRGGYPRRGLPDNREILSDASFIIEEVKAAMC